MNDCLIAYLLASSISLGQTMCGMWKSKMLVLIAARLGIFCIQQELSKFKSNLTPFKTYKMINPNHYLKELPKSFPANYSKRFV